MPVLSNPRHERFAQELFRGKSAIDAYGDAGYSPDRGAATRLSANVSIVARVRELQETAAQRVIDAGIFEAKQMFADLLQDIVDAKQAGDHKTAIDGRKFLLRCFGYEDSPTLTHEHVKGQKIAPETPTDGAGEANEPSEPQTAGANILPLTKAIRDLKRKVGG